jgi:hypothetical protein
MPIDPRLELAPIPTVENGILELRALYQKAHKDLQAKLEKATLTDAQRFRYGSQAKQVDAIVKGLNRAVKRFPKTMAGTAFLDGQDLAKDALAEIGESVPAGALGTAINTRTVQAVAKQMAADLTAANQSMGVAARRILRKTQQIHLKERDLNERIAQGILGGKTRQQVSREIARDFERLLGPGVPVEVVGKGGRRVHFDPDYYAEMVARTQTREAATEGMLTTCEAADVDLVQISVHDNACPICQPLQGKVYSRTGKDKRFPPLDRQPPYHPNCGHVVVPYVDALEDPEDVRTLAKLSKDPDACIHSWEDYQRVSAGGRPSRKPQEWPEDVLAKKRAAKARARKVAAAKA